MSIVSNKFYEELEKRQPQQPVQPQPVQPSAVPVVQSSLSVEDQEKLRAFDPVSQPSRPFISEEEQIKRFGAPVGSDEYYRFRNIQPGGRPNLFQVAGTGERGLGPRPLRFRGMLRDVLQPVEEETWDKMSRLDQSAMTGKNAARLGVKMIAALPTVLVKVIPSVAFTATQMAANVANGRPWYTAEKQVVWGAPTAFKTREELKDHGYSELESDFWAALHLVGDVMIGGSLAGAARSALTPKYTLKPGETIKARPDPVPPPGVRQVESTASYSTLDKTTTAKYGGNSQNTYFKITPAGEGSVEIAVVKSVEGAIPKGVNYVKTKFGYPEKVYQGKYGAEIKLESQIVKVKTAEIAASPIPKFTPKPDFSPLENLKLELSGLEIAIKEHPAFALTKFAKDKKTELPEVVGLTQAEKAAGKRVSQYGRKGDDIAKSLGFDDVEEAARAYEGLVTLRKERVKLQERLKEERTVIGEKFDEAAERASLDASIALETEIEVALNRISGSILDAIPAAPLKGRVNALISDAEIKNVELLAKIQGIDGESLRAMSHVVTGKQAIGDLTHAEYVSLAQTMGSVGTVPAQLNIPEAARMSFLGHKLSPVLNYADKAEKITGYPLASQFVLPMEEAFNFVKRETFNFGIKKNEIFGKYNQAKYQDERILVKRYIEGDTKLISENPALTPQVKADLVKIAESMRSLTKEAGKIYKVSMERFGEFYQSSVREAERGVFQLYAADLKDFPTSPTAFARFQRRGSISPMLEDASSLFDIYIRSLAMEKYVKPVLSRVAADLYPKVPANLQQWMRTAVAEKLGYATEFQRKLSNFGLKLNNKLGTKMPPDVLQNLVDDSLLTIYSGALGAPRFDAPIRDMITTTMIAYGRLGNRHAASGFKKAVDPKYIDYVRRKGWLVEFGIPGGEDIARTRAGVTGLRGQYRQLAETTLKPYGAGDNWRRAWTAAQAEELFNESIAKFNAGKITWEQMEKEMTLDKMRVPSQDFIRQRLGEKNIERARDHYVSQIIDETSFPYRRATGAPVTFGPEGHLAFNLSNWNIHFAHTLGRWAQTGQWDNIVRFLVAGEISRRTLEESFGIDASRFTALNKITNITLSPVLQVVQNLMTAFNNARENNRRAFNESSGELVRTAVALQVPGGVGIINWNQFLKSYRNFEKYGALEGMYPVFNRFGKVTSYADFTDIFWKGFGLTPISQSEVTEFSRTSANAKFEYDMAREKAVKLIAEAEATDNPTTQQRKWLQAEEIINEYQITNITDSVLNYLKPSILQKWNQLPLTLKDRFEPWYNELLEQQKL